MEYKEILVETTPELLPHTYYLNDAGKLAAFKRAGEDEIKVFTKPLMFDKKRRTFKKVKA